MQPSLEGFILFIRNVMDIEATILPDNSPSIEFSYRIALEVVNINLSLASNDLYSLAVYNLGGDFLINYTQDTPPSVYFADLRAKFKIYQFIPGVLEESHDVSTGQKLLNPDFMKNLMLSDLQNLKTPYGLRYLAIAQWYGPTIWGIS